MNKLIIKTKTLSGCLIQLQEIINNNGELLTIVKDADSNNYMIVYESKK